MLMQAFGHRGIGVHVVEVEAGDTADADARLGELGSDLRGLVLPPVMARQVLGLRLDHQLHAAKAVALEELDALRVVSGHEPDSHGGLSSGLMGPPHRGRLSQATT